MMWVGLATVIMMSSGAGDDFGRLRRMVEALEAAVAQTLEEPARRAEALLAVDRIGTTVEQVEASALRVSACLERADRRYEATAEDYAACGRLLEETQREVAETYVDARARFEAAVPPHADAEIERLVALRLSR